MANQICTFYFRIWNAYTILHKYLDNWEIEVKLGNYEDYSKLLYRLKLIAKSTRFLFYICRRTFLMKLSRSYELSTGFFLL